MAVTNFTANITTGTAPLTVNFTDLSSPVPTGWIWNFGDGQTSSDQNPIHTYIAPGIYSVTLVITSPGGYAIETKNAYINVEPPPPIANSPTYRIASTGSVSVDSQLNVSQEINVGNNEGGGVISTGPGQDILLTTGGAPIPIGLIDSSFLPSASYTSGIYSNVPLYGGQGTGALATVSISFPSLSANITNGGNGYASQDNLYILSTDVGGSGTPLYAIRLVVGNVSGGNISISPSNALVLNNVEWPKGANGVGPGQYLGASDLNVLNFYPFILGFAPGDSLNNAALNLLFPNAQPGQYAVGPNTAYMCVNSGTWRRFISDSGLRSVSNNISSSGNTRLTATPLTSEINVVQTVNPGEGVSLPSEQSGLVISVLNISSSSLFVYPGSGGASINSLPAGDAIQLLAGDRITFMCVSSTQWYTMNAA